MSGRKPLLTRLTGVTLSLCASIAVGCGETSDGADDGLGGSGRAGAAGAGAGGGGAGAGGTAGGAAGSSGGSTAGAGSGGSAGLAGSGGGNGVPAGCPIPSPIPLPGQVIVIQSVKFGTLSTEDNPVIPAEIVLKNVSDTDQIIVGGRQGWQWCDFPVYWNVVLTDEDVTLAPGATYAFIAFNNMGPWALERDGGEMGIYSTPGSFDDSINMRAFASWGVFGCEEEQTCLPSREYAAVDGDYWTLAERIRIGPLDAGFVLVGDTSRAQGYRSVPERCLVAPPNP